VPGQCQLTGKQVQFGNNVSHSNRKSSRRFHPNLQRVSLHSEALGRAVPLRIAVGTLRSVQKAGGLDAFLLAADEARLTPEGARLKHRVHRALAGRRTA
jgi:large subunit ribosomal protein L28